MTVELAANEKQLVVMQDLHRKKLPEALLMAMLAVFTVCAAEKAEEKPAVVELQGRVKQEGKANLLFEADNGAVYKLKRDEMSEALFADTNLHSKVLVLKGRIAPDKKTFQVTGNLHSAKDGQRHELFYYCDICSITTSIPGLCLCCREPVELREEPVE